MEEQSPTYPEPSNAQLYQMHMQQSLQQFQQQQQMEMQMQMSQMGGYLNPMQQSPAFSNMPMPPPMPYPPYGAFPMPMPFYGWPPNPGSMMCPPYSMLPPPVPPRNPEKTAPSKRSPKKQSAAVHKRIIGRTPHTEKQRKALMERFQQSETIDKEERIRLGDKLNLTEQQIKTWFQNMRQKKRKEKQLGAKPTESTDSKENVKFESNEPTTQVLPKFEPPGSFDQYTNDFTTSSFIDDNPDGIPLFSKENISPINPEYFGPDILDL